MFPADKRLTKTAKTDATRNVFCPHYNAFLDNAVRKYLHRWDCTDCKYEKVLEPIDPTEAERCKTLLNKVFHKTPTELFKLISKRLLKSKHQ